MLRIDRASKKLVRVAKSALADTDHWERHLQGMICADAESFCEEIGESLRVIGQEVRPSEAIPDRIDILAIDETGNSVVIELKRGTNKLQLLQALSYAGMISRWPADRFIETLAQSYRQSPDDARSTMKSTSVPT
jgi:RecB family endonuclease NucS